MDKYKKILRALLVPHVSVLLLLLPVATALLVYSMACLDTESVVAIASYVLAAYTLTVWCLRIPKLAAWVKSFKSGNRYMQLWTGDVHLRMKVSLWGTFLWNGAYGLFQLCLGLYHGSFWFYSLAAYYFLLAQMRFFLARHTRKHAPGHQMRTELKKYRACGVVFLIMNLALSVMVFFMIYWDRTFYHHQVTTIAMAAYTFTALTFAIVNMVRYRKYNSPVYSASKAISLASACVSMITLTSTMLTTFGQGDDPAFRRLMLGLLGGAVSVFIVTMAVYMIVRAQKALKRSTGE